MNVVYQWSADFDGEVPARRRQDQTGIIVGNEIIVDIESAKKCQFAVHHTDFAMRTHHATSKPRVEAAMIDARFAQFFVEQFGLLRSGTKPVGNHIGRHPALSRAHQRGLHRIPGFVGGKDIGFQIDFDLRRINGSDQRRKKFGAAIEERNVVMGGKNYRTHEKRNPERKLIANFYITALVLIDASHKRSVATIGA